MLKVVQLFAYNICGYNLHESNHPTPWSNWKTMWDLNSNERYHFLKNKQSKTSLTMMYMSISTVLLLWVNCTVCNIYIKVCFSQQNFVMRRLDPYII